MQHDQNWSCDPALSSPHYLHSPTKIVQSDMCQITLQSIWDNFKLYYT